MPIKNRKDRNEYMRKYHLKRYHDIRDELIQYLGGMCWKCGRKERLELDHRDPKSKEFEVSVFLSVSLNKLYLEIEKCQVLCQKCHIKKTLKEKGQKSAQGTHGTLSSYRYCKCVLCKRAMSDYNREYKKRTRG